MVERALTVGLALREQVLAPGEVPMGEWDWKVDGIVSPDAIYGIRGDPLHTVNEEGGLRRMAS